jgi:hypothetical protein
MIITGDIKKQTEHSLINNMISSFFILPHHSVYLVGQSLGLWDLIMFIIGHFIIFNNTLNQSF